jgi:hypothetical protein
VIFHVYWALSRAVTIPKSNSGLELRSKLQLCLRLRLYHKHRRYITLKKPISTFQYALLLSLIRPRSRRTPTTYIQNMTLTISGCQGFILFLPSGVSLPQ